jgi:hypothetical protein
MLIRKTYLALGALALVAALATAAFPQAKVVVQEQLTITIDKNTVRTDVPPIMVQGRTLVPVRGVFNAFNAQINWLPAVQRVHVLSSTQEIWLRIGVAHADVNDQLVPLDVPPMIYRGRTMVPLRFIAETLGATVSWDPNTQQITIVTQRTAQVQQPPPAQAQPAPLPPVTEAPPPPPPPDSGDTGTEENAPAPTY